MALASPIVFLALIEWVLWAMGLFTPIDYLIPAKHNDETRFISNPEFGRRFLVRSGIPMPSPIWAKSEKNPDTLRVLLLGESAAAGFPHPEFNLARVMRHVWTDRYPEINLDVINLTMVGVNSHVLRIMADEGLRKLNPDLLILYAGHNEAIGPYGPASVFGSMHHSLGLIRMNLAIRNTRTGRLLASAYTRITGDGAAPKWVGLDEFRETPTRNNDPRLALMAEHFERNVTEIIDQASERDVGVLVLNPAANLNDWPPLGSDSDTLDFENARNAWEQYGASASGLTSAWQVYRLARHYQEAGDWNSAWPLYRLANDLDHYRFRADARIQAALASAATKSARQHVLRLDVDRMMHEENPAFRNDRDFFCEHVHLTFRGRAFVADIAVQGIARLAGLESRPAVRHGDVKQLARDMIFPPMDERVVWSSVSELLSLGVFAKQPERDARNMDMELLMGQLSGIAEKEWNEGMLIQALHQSLTLIPDDPLTYFVAARHFRGYGEARRSEELLQQGLNIFPTYPQAWIALAELEIGRGVLDDAMAALDNADQFSIDLPLVRANRGLIHARKNELIDARRELELALKAALALYGSMVNLANVYLLLKEDALAIEMFTKCLGVTEQDHGVLNNFAWLLATSKIATPAQRSQSLEMARRAIELKPDTDVYKPTLALAYATTGQYELARQTAASVEGRLMMSGQKKLVDDMRTELAAYGIGR